MEKEEKGKVGQRAHSASGLDIYLVCDEYDIGHVVISSRPRRMKLFTAGLRVRSHWSTSRILGGNGAGPGGAIPISHTEGPARRFCLDCRPCRSWPTPAEARAPSCRSPRARQWIVAPGVIRAMEILWVGNGGPLFVRRPRSRGVGLPQAPVGKYIHRTIAGKVIPKGTKLELAVEILS